MNAMTTPAVNPETGTKYIRAELHAAFTRVQNPTNWKMPIAGILIPEADRDVTLEAVIFFAGCTPTFLPVKRAGFEGQLRVDAVGYYAAVGA